MLSDFHLGVLCVATTLRRTGAVVEVLDPAFLSSDARPQDVAREILDRRPDVVGFSCMCVNYPLFLLIAGQIKKIRPDLPVVFGGPHATVTAEETLRAFPQVDIVVRGESESMPAPLLRAFSGRAGLADVPGLTFRNHTDIVTTLRAPAPPFLDDIPFPDLSLWPTFEESLSDRSLKYVPVEVGRGCPFRCSFCCLQEISGGSNRLRSHESVTREILRLNSRYGMTHFNLVHDNLTASRSRLSQLCEALSQMESDVAWFGNARIDSLDPELLDTMARAGCESLFLGVETGSQRLQDIIGKRLNVDRIVPTVRRIAEAGMTFVASFIAGFPEERMEDLLGTITLILQLSLTQTSREQMYNLDLAVPLPGSPQFDRHSDQMFFDGYSSMIDMALLSTEEIDIIQQHPEVLAPFFAFPTPDLDRQTLVRIKGFVLNLVNMPYTVFLLLHDTSLRFPQCAFEDGALKGFPLLQPTGDVRALRKVGDFLSAIFGKQGLADHPIHEVIRYDLALKEAIATPAGRPGVVTEDFIYDLRQWSTEVRKSGFTQAPALERRTLHFLAFMAGEGYVDVRPVPMIPYY